ncbi:hypothetical protein J7M23_01605 [Candidatus Sumerlaeota bacterium]|nr:hypothetical protein [Candidatus Sumerlaeota bacterium]
MFNPEKEVPSLELCKQLKEFGFPQEGGGWYWKEGKYELVLLKEPLVLCPYYYEAELDDGTIDRTCLLDFSQCNVEKVKISTLLKKYPYPQAETPVWIKCPKYPIIKAPTDREVGEYLPTEIEDEFVLRWSCSPNGIHKIWYESPKKVIFACLIRDGETEVEARTRILLELARMGIVKLNKEKG